jgi:restriction system protein
VAFVQCKHWKAGTVGVEAVRELSGVMTAESVKHGVIVTCGGFTLDAMEFASASSIALIDGPRLMQLIASAEQSEDSQVQQQAGREWP